MLVISLENRGEPVLIGSDGISVQVVDIRGGRVRLGIVAPKEVKVLRKGLVDRQDGNQESTEKGV
ncbi:MAG: carbon storage regulator [Proteobacteria bacterium]|nr:carbon storage regulator [Pseudomonadota bacterium]